MCAIPQMEHFFLDVANIPMEELKYCDVKEIGMELDWFSHVFGRTILVGRLCYESFKNYKCKSEFEENVLDHPLNVPTVIFIHDWHSPDIANNKLARFGSLENVFNGQFKEIAGIKNRFIFEIVPPKIKKNGKPEKQFNIQRKKRFRIPVMNGMCSDGRVVKSTVISCTFRDLK